MTLSDFDFCGFVTLSRFLRIETAEQALALGDFLDEGDEVLDAFYAAGPGVYYVLLDKGWGRVGDTFILIIKKVPERVLTPPEFLEALSTLSRTFDATKEPFALARSIKTQGEYHQLTDEQKALLANLDHDAYEDAKQALTDFLEGARP